MREVRGTDAGLEVSIDVSAVPEQPAGAGRYTVELVRALGRDPAVSLVLWAREGDHRWRPLAGPSGEVHVLAPRRRPTRLVWEQLRLPKLLAGTGAAVHHGPHYTLPERARLPLVATVHDLTFFEHPEWHERSKVRFFRRAIVQAGRRAAVVVCVSPTTAERFVERCQPSARVVVVPHGVDHERFTAQEPEPGSDAMQLASVGVRGPFVAFLGTLEPRKAVPTLLAAFDRLAPMHPELRLVLAGRPGWGQGSLAGALSSCRHRDRVLCTGYIPDAAVPALLRQAAAVAYPSVDEGFGLPALEALACGAPLVTTAGTAMADIARGAALEVAPEDAGQLAEAIEACLAGGPEMGRRRQAGLAEAARFTWEASASGHLDAYRWAAALAP